MRRPSGPSRGHCWRCREAWAGRALTIGRDYVRRCQKLGREPDMELLGPILEVLQRMQEGPADDEEGGGQ